MELGCGKGVGAEYDGGGGNGPVCCAEAGHVTNSKPKTAASVSAQGPNVCLCDFWIASCIPSKFLSTSKSVSSVRSFRIALGLLRVQKDAQSRLRTARSLTGPDRDGSVFDVIIREARSKCVPSI